MKPALVNESLGLVQSALEQWLSFKKYLVLATSNEEIVQEYESDFLENKSNLARATRALGEKMKEVGRLDIGEKLLKELLNKCVSITNISHLPPADKRQLLKDWHTVFIKLSRAIGALKMLSEGYVPEEATKKKKKKKAGMAAYAVPAIVVVVIAGGIWFASFMGLF
ncbi:MAG: hypothetical protein ACFCU1_01295 [Sumerlaeia bacterium]